MRTCATAGKAVKKQPAEPVMQLWLATAHLTAALIASAIAVTHALAVRYHLDRIAGDTPEDHDLSYADALRRKEVSK